MSEDFEVFAWPPITDISAYYNGKALLKGALPNLTPWHLISLDIHPRPESDGLAELVQLANEASEP